MFSGVHGQRHKNDIGEKKCGDSAVVYISHRIENPDENELKILFENVCARFIPGYEIFSYTKKKSS